MARKRFDGMKQAYVVQWPRGTMKSTIGVTDYAIWILLNEPNARILVDCETATKALAYQKVIRSYFEAPFFQELFGKLYDPRKDWNDERMCVLRTVDGIKEPSIDCGGAEKDKTGNHYDYILSDDVVGETNSKTVDQIQKVIGHIGQYTPLLDSDGMVAFFMTRWAFGDAGEWIEDENKAAIRDVRPQPYIINRKPAYKEDPDGRYTDAIEFPLLHTRATLLHALNQLKPYQFSCQYLLKPQSPEASAFQHRWIKWIGTDCPDIPTETAPRGSNIYITLDPASSKKAGSDFSAIIVAAVQPDFTIYILDVIRRRWTGKEIYTALDNLTTMYQDAGGQNVAIGMETVFKQKDLFLEIKMQAQLHNRVLPIRPFTTSTQNKAHRIMGLQPLMQAGRFYMRRRQGDSAYLEDEIVKFDPKRIDSQRNDCLDAAAYLVEMINKPDQMKAADLYSSDDWKEKLEESNRKRKAAGFPEEKMPDQATLRMIKWHKVQQSSNANKKDRVLPLSVVLMDR
jgi:predicted phage terminase large subunit-like protein